MCMLHVRVFFSLDQIRYPSIIQFVLPSQSSPLFLSLRFRTPHFSTSSTISPIPYASFIPAMDSRMLFYYIVSAIHHKPPQSMYIYTSVCARIAFLSFYTTTIPTALVGEDLDLDFPDDADRHSIEPRG
jgi:hypothetical protein